MERLSREGLPLTLCLSLHAADDATRAKIMPAARAFTVRQVIDAVKGYIAVTGRRAIIEYALIAGVNDSMADASHLAALLKGVQCHVNLIPLNTVAEAGLAGSSSVAVDAFLTELKRFGVSATRRRTLGEVIEGACGQLRRRHTGGE
jgi:23S rRNA (adenine2503-C2)-methyltransferase